MKSFNRITYHDRVLIETRYCTDDQSMRSIARELNKSPSAISREIVGKPRVGMGRYRASVAEKSEDGRIPVELDYINGDHHDNRIKNLRILCPNCHSLQLTHRGKNKRRRGGEIGR